MKPKLKIIFIISCLLLFVSVNIAQAGLVKCGSSAGLGPNPTPEEIAANQCSIHYLVEVVVNIINYLLAWAWLVALFFVVWAGWEMINAAGNEEAITKAKSALTHAIIGFFLVMASFLLLNFIISVATGQTLDYQNSVKDAFGVLNNLPKNK